MVAPTSYPPAGAVHRMPCQPCRYIYVCGTGFDVTEWTRFGGNLGGTAGSSRGGSAIDSDGSVPRGYLHSSTSRSSGAPDGAIATSKTMPRFLISLLAQYDPADGWIGTWSPGIGDPNFFGWLTVAAYLLAAILCLRVARRLPGPKNRGFAGFTSALGPMLMGLFASRRKILLLPAEERERALWLALSGVLFFLGINKQLDLQTALTEIGRIMAQSEGWYAARREVQVAFILGILLVGLWLLRAVFSLASGNIRKMRSVLLGTIFLICFVAIRATSFHHVDELLGLTFAGFKVNWFLELGGIALVIWGARKAMRRSRTAGPRAT
jgi:hypothetical protein